MKGYVRVKISGLNLTRIIDKLVGKGVVVDDLKTKRNVIIFSINENYLNELNSICKQEHKFYEIVYRWSLSNVFVKMRYCIGFILAFCISFCYILSYSGFVVNVNLSYSSNIAYDMTEVKTLLKQNGIVEGVRKNIWGVEKIQNLILSNMSDIAGCEIEYKGGNLDICVYPSTQKNDSSSKQILSKYDGVVTGVEVFSGDSKVSVGDIVRIGDVLIDSDEVASGAVKGKVYFVGTQLYNERQIKIEKTGNIYCLKNYKLFNKYLSKQTNKCNFTSYLTQKCSFYISDKYFLPIICEEIIYYETVVKEEVVAFKSVENEIMEKAYLEALKKVDDEKDITNVTYSIVNDGEYTRVDCFIEVEISLF